jgi:hypothetical protein
MKHKVIKVIRPMIYIYKLKLYKLHLLILPFILDLVQCSIYRAFDFNNLKYKHIP